MEELGETTNQFEVVKWEAVKVPAGTFKAIHVRHLQVTRPMTVIDSWYAADVGLFKTTMEHPDFPKPEMQLTKFRGENPEP